MLNSVEVKARSLAQYVSVVGEEMVEAVRTLAAPLRGARVLHVNATAYGGGVAEILHWLVPLMRDVGLVAEWRVIGGSDEFFEVTKAMHNGLQGMDLPFTPEMQDLWRRTNEANARALKGEYDFLVVHDPQPAGLLCFHGREGGRHWIWRCHIDTSTPNPAFWEFLVPYLAPYDAYVFTMAEYLGPGLDRGKAAIIPPKIDPLSPKNLPVPEEEQEAVLRRFGVDPTRPLLCQVSRFDPWKDPLGVIDAYRLVKEAIPGVQLALVGSMAADDPEGWTYYDRTLRHAGEDLDIVVLHNFHGVGDREVAAFQAAADVAIQKSLREGFGLVVSEALWKGTPVVGGNVGGIRLQVLHGETGYLVDSVEDCAHRCLELLRDPERARAMGQAGRERVRRNFLSVHHLRDYLHL
ncbi:MAG: glycosyltransferase, partial [Anaerolineae bacterium]